MSDVLDVCCGSRMFYFDRENENVIYMDKRSEDHTLCDGRNLFIRPDVVADFRAIPYRDESFDMVVFDPPHLERAGDKSWLALKYGKLGTNWRDDIASGFKECFRVLREGGTMVFKWNEDQIALREILPLSPIKPLFGNKRSKTHWIVFYKSRTA